METLWLGALTGSLIPGYLRLKSQIPDSIDIVYTGQPGSIGPNGVSGPSGPVGSGGNPGMQGPYGMRGVTGPTGPAGLAGVPGLLGPTGATGFVGPTGAQPANLASTVPSWNFKSSSGSRAIVFVNDFSDNVKFSLDPNFYYLITGSYSITSSTSFPNNATIETTIYDLTASDRTTSTTILPVGRTSAFVSFSELVGVSEGTVTVQLAALKNPALPGYPDGSLGCNGGNLTTFSATKIAAYP